MFTATANLNNASLGRIPAVFTAILLALFNGTVAHAVLAFLRVSHTTTCLELSVIPRILELTNAMVKAHRGNNSEEG